MVADVDSLNPITDTSSTAVSAPVQELESNDMIFTLSGSASAFRRKPFGGAERAPQVGSYSRSTG